MTQRLRDELIKVDALVESAQLSIRRALAMAEAENNKTLYIQLDELQSCLDSFQTLKNNYLNNSR